ncbi:MAG TPA: hypothetical protein DDW30_08685 [Clostridiales bacterium]|nr:hypothetical protein [Clostridiales bacterium]
MSKNRSILNVAVSIFFKIALLIGNLFVRRYLIRFVGNDVNGLNSLYLSIIGMLSVVELGIGSAIIYCMYKPIVMGDTEKVLSLYKLFKKIYLVIGGIIAIAGCALMPFLPYLAKGYADIDVNLYLTFGIMLLSVVITYFFSAQTSLMNAYEDNYVSTTITSCGQLLQYVLQIVILFVTKSFVWYLGCRIVAALLQWGLSEKVAKRRYSFVFASGSKRIDTETKKEIVKNVKAMFMHRIGGVLVNTIDSIIISAFIGVTILGKYSNYTTIMTAMTGTITLFFTPLTATIGRLFIKDGVEFKKYYHFFCTLNFSLGCIFFFGYYGIIDDLITLLFGAGLQLEKSISFVITVNYFIQFMRQSTLLFRDASGTFYYDRWKPIFEGLSNLILSILFVLIFQKAFNDNLAVVGVIVATIITNLTICHIVEPHVLHKYAFHSSTKKYYMRNYAYMLIFTLLLLVMNFCLVKSDNKIIELLLNGAIAVGFSVIPIAGAIILDKDFRFYAKSVLKGCNLKCQKKQ